MARTPTLLELDTYSQRDDEYQTNIKSNTPTRSRSFDRTSDPSSYRSEEGIALHLTHTPSSLTNGDLSTKKLCQGNDGDMLKEKLHQVLRECPRHEYTYLAPIDAQEKLITIESVTKDMRARNPAIKESDAKAIATKACKCGKQLYAILAYIKKGPDIRSLLEEGLTDNDLPFARLSKPTRLTRSSGDPITTFRDWEEKKLLKFHRIQWWMTAPVFKNQEHHELHKNTILPFVPFDLPEAKKKAKQGGYSTVYPVRIHPAHHTFWKNCNEEVNRFSFQRNSLTDDPAGRAFDSDQRTVFFRPRRL